MKDEKTNKGNENSDYQRTNGNNVEYLVLDPSFVDTSVVKDIGIDADLWTIGYLIDTMKKHVANIKQPIINRDECRCDGDDRVVDSRKYYDRAYNMLKIGAFRPAPPYIIFLRDLTPKIIKELYHLDENDLGYVLKQAVVP